MLRRVVVVDETGFGNPEILGNQEVCQQLAVQKTGSRFLYYGVKPISRYRQNKYNLPPDVLTEHAHFYCSRKVVFYQTIYFQPVSCYAPPLFFPN